MPEIPGVWCGRGDFAELLYVWVHGLADDERGWDLIRLAFPPRLTIDDDTYLRFFLDPNNSDRKKQQLLETLMSNEIAVPTNEGSWERCLAMRQRGREEGIELGVERGREEGIELGVERGREESLIAIAQTFMSDDQLNPICQLADRYARIERLKQAILERLSE